MSRSQRRVVPGRAVPEDVLHAVSTLGRCPDCASATELREVLPRVFQLLVLHDGSCPWLRAREEGRGR